MWVVFEHEKINEKNRKKFLTNAYLCSIIAEFGSEHNPETKRLYLVN